MVLGFRVLGVLGFRGLGAAQGFGVEGCMHPP